ncbi:MAG: flavin monoamine oxidase family protein [Gulosibacter sp.]|uniref:flavin monoamine oxidase family protein n=1 Tax=Gulosibacter sp. TaxID=2817531 RepID=UPI003F923361
MTRVAIIGAGYAGLAAANRLVDLGHEITVFEARERVGGRVWSETLESEFGEHTIERGAEFVLPDYYRMRELTEEFGLRLVETGMSYYIREPQDVPGVTAADITALGSIAAELVSTLGPDATAENVLQELDAAPALVDAFRSRIEISTAVKASEVTTAALHHVASFKPLKSYRIAGGNQSLAHSLAARVGEVIRYETRVNRVTQVPGGGVEVATDAGTEQFDAAVVAVPIGVLRSALVDAPTTDARQQAMRGVVQGHAAKMHAPLTSIPETSAMMSVAGRYWTWTAIDATDSVPPVLNGFIGTKEAITEAGVEVDPSDWLQNVRNLREDRSIADGAVVTVWADNPFSLGTYSAHSPAFSTEDSAALEAPVGDVYFAGEYADPEYGGLMEGALRSGERAAERVNAAVPAAGMLSN